VTAGLFEQSFDELAVGDRFETGGRTITETDVVSFAALTGDFHPQHTDAEWASGSQFGERIAHGLLVLSYSIGLITFDPGRVVALRKLSDVAFKAPVRFGDTVRLEGEIARLTEAGSELGLVTCAWRIRNQERKTVVRATVEILWRRSAAASIAGEPGLEMQRTA
jgi:3-hydroxybutyryl-CoA dehydratase